MSSASSCISSLIADGTPNGIEKTIGGLPTYVAEPKSRSKAKTVIIISDLFGWKTRNVRLLADAYAQSGFNVYVPDFQQGSSFDPSFLQTLEPPLRARNELSLIDRAKNTAATAAALGPWQLTNRDAVVAPLVDNFIQAVRAMSGTGKIGGLGFGFGGRHAILHANNGGLNAAVAFYPSSVSIPTDLRDLGRPLSLGIAAEDGVVDALTRAAMVDALEARTDVPHEVRQYEGQVHGFATRGDGSEESDKRAMKDAQQQGCSWFHKYLA